MTIKEIKEQWKKNQTIKGLSGKLQFSVFKFSEPVGKSVVIVVNDYYLDRYVVGVVQVSSGIDLIGDHSRPCDNMEDAVDVAGEMISDAVNAGELIIDGAEIRTNFQN